MQPHKSYLLFTKVLLVFLFLVIVAGSIVRATQSGMGCPDWPTCFGNAIPPTQEYQVHFQAHHTYKRGQFIIYNDSLKYAKEAFTSTRVYNPNNWQQYEKNNYAKFNLYQTWIEYINRLTTGVLGILIVIHIVWSFRLFYKKRNSIVWLSISLLVLTSFEAWLGKVVVDTNLAVVKVTLHMLFALLIAAAAVIIINLLQQQEKIKNNQLKWLSFIAIILTLVQIIIGTDVREQIDEISLAFGYQGRNSWIAQLNNWFSFHRNFAFVVGIICIYLFWQSLAYKPLQKLAAGLLATVAATILVGFIMMYVNIPAAAQPLHVLLSSILIITLFAYRLRLR